MIHCLVLPGLFFRRRCDPAAGDKSRARLTCAPHGWPRPLPNLRGPTLCQAICRPTSGRSRMSPSGRRQPSHCELECRERVMRIADSAWDTDGDTRLRIVSGRFGRTNTWSEYSTPSRPLISHPIASRTAPHTRSAQQEAFPRQLPGRRFADCVDATRCDDRRDAASTSRCSRPDRTSTRRSRFSPARTALSR